MITVIKDETVTVRQMSGDVSEVFPAPVQYSSVAGREFLPTRWAINYRRYEDGPWIVENWVAYGPILVKDGKPGERVGRYRGTYAMRPAEVEVFPWLAELIDKNMPEN